MNTPAPITAATLVVAGLVLASPATAQTEAPIETIEVVGVTPLGGDLDTDRIAANVQTASADELREKNALDLADFMKRQSIPKSLRLIRQVRALIRDKILASDVAASYPLNQVQDAVRHAAAPGKGGKVLLRIAGP